MYAPQARLTRSCTGAHFQQSANVGSVFDVMHVQLWAKHLLCATFKLSVIFRRVGDDGRTPVRFRCVAQITSSPTLSLLYLHISSFSATHITDSRRHLFVTRNVLFRDSCGCAASLAGGISCSTLQRKDLQHRLLNGCDVKASSKLGTL